MDSHATEYIGVFQLSINKLKFRESVPNDLQMTFQIHCCLFASINFLPSTYKPSLSINEEYGLRDQLPTDRQSDQVCSKNKTLH